MSGYSFLLLLTLVVSAPWWLWRMARTGRYREGLRERLGIVPDALRAAVASKRVVWVHAVSVGEVLAAERMIAELKAALGDGWVVAVSTTTATGNKIARERLRGSPVFYLPLDFAFAVRRYLRVLRPSLLVLMENEMWPRLLTECNRRGIPVAMANARVSDRSFNKAAWRHRLWRPMLRKVDLYLAQGAETAERLVAMGAPVERVKVTGNLKYDLRPLQENRLTMMIRNGLYGRSVIVAGSTVNGKPLWEEEIVMLGMQRVWASRDDVVLVLAPRHPPRFAEMLALARDHGGDVVKATELLAGASMPSGAKPTILLDTIGDLASIYELANVAFIGGSLVKSGGHNPLEAARFGVPVLIGSSYENFRDVVVGMKAANAIRIVEDTEDLGKPLSDLLADGQNLGQRGRAFFETQAGATRRTVDALLALIGESK